MHVCPALNVLPAMMRSAATRVLKSEPTIVGDLPPSSSVTGTRFSLAARMTIFPTRVEPGEDEVIERQLREGLAHLGPAGHHRDLVGGERLGDEIAQELRGLGDELARLDHGAVARRERRDERSEGQRHRVVPGRDDPDDAERLVEDAARRRHELEARLALLGLHPVAQVLPRVPDLAEQDEDLRDERLVLGAVAEVSRDRLSDPVLALAQRPLELVERFEPRFVRRHPREAGRGADASQRGVEVARGRDLRGLRCLGGGSHGP